MALKLVHSRDNPLVKTLRRLAESGRERRKSGRTVLDGIHLIAAYEESLGAVETLVTCEQGLANGEIAAFVGGRDAICLSDALFRDVAVVDSPSGLLAIAAIPAAREARGAVDSVLLDGVQDPGNVGTLIRTAAAAGFAQVLLSEECAAAWSPRVLRAGQGAHFAIAIHEDVDLTAFMHSFQGQTVVTALDDAVSLYAAPLEPPLAWVFGSEGRGVRPAVAAAAALRVNIPMPGRVESLNVGAAAAVCLFESLRQRTS